MIVRNVREIWSSTSAVELGLTTAGRQAGWQTNFRQSSKYLKLAVNKNFDFSLCLAQHYFNTFSAFCRQGGFGVL